MNNIITTHDDLLLEKQRLQALLATHKQNIKTDIHAIREEIKPAINIFSILEKLIVREEGNDAVVSTSTNLTIDLLTTRLFSKSNFMVRLLLPMLLKNLSSHYVPKAGSVLKRIFRKKEKVDE